MRSLAMKLKKINFKTSKVSLNARMLTPSFVYPGCLEGRSDI